MKRNMKSEVHLRERVVHELKEFAVIAAYLFVCFTAVACLKAAILKAHGISFAPFAFAAQSCSHRACQQARPNGLGNDDYRRALQLSGLAEGLTRSRRHPA
jgi:hypothetical protein